VTAPIVGPKSVERLTRLLPAGDMDLPDDIRAACDDLVTPGSFVASFFNSATWVAWKQ
jgi:1-deoxyxylulose-5-phosphate synthase